MGAKTGFEKRFSTIKAGYKASFSDIRAKFRSLSPSFPVFRGDHFYVLRQNEIIHVVIPLEQQDRLYNPGKFK